MDALNRLQELLRSLFQYDLADLDFGIYRLLRLKRAEVDAFLNKQLPYSVDAAFAAQAGEDRQELEKRAQSLATRVLQEIDENALDADGNVKPEYAKMPARAIRVLVEEYTEARAALQAAHTGDAAKAEVFNHLYNFFSRYYDEGDFIAKRRYGSQETYAVPYNGEETFFTWANRDQYYIKSGERFRDYSFTVPTTAGEYRVRFFLTEASTTPGNSKGEMRFFFPLGERMEWDADARSLRIPFEYRVPSEEEAKQDVENGNGKKLKGQDAILASQEPDLRAQIPEDILATALGQPAGEEDSGTLLLRHLRHFAKRNTTDYFIHKDLRGFLERELEFYIKDQFLSVDDMQGDLASRLRALRVLRKIATDVITFLAQIEDFQKRVFEKRKLIFRTDYLAPIQNVPRELWAEVLRNEKQVEEWQRLYAIDAKPSLGNPAGGVNEHFLEEHPTLVVNTAHFDEGFKLRLLAGFEDLDEATDGLLVNSENYQALCLLLPCYAGKVKCIYIDPPYNTSDETFNYKNTYKHSSWVAMMSERTRVAWGLLRLDGVFETAIDDEEVYHLKQCLDDIFGAWNYLATLVIQSNPRGRTTNTFFATCHDYCLVYARELSQAKVYNLDLTPEQAADFGMVDDVSPYRLLPFRRSGGLSTPGERPNSCYRILYHADRKTVAVESADGKNLLAAVPGKEPREISSSEMPDAVEIWPVDSSGTMRVWRQTRPSLLSAVTRGDIVIKRDGDRYTVLMKDRIKEGRKPKTIWADSKYDASTHGTVMVQNILGEARSFSYPKALSTVVDVLRVTTKGDRDAVVADFFAGSGTTGHAVINLNRDDGAHRKFILVEMADYFDTVLLPRIQKVMYAPEWKDGKPKRLPNEDETKRTPRLVKVLRLESYEDALHNLTTAEELARQEKRAAATRQAVGEDAYRLSYLLRLSRESGDTLLNLAKLEHPFQYTLDGLTDDGPRTEHVDLVETFNYLAGLRVRRVERWINEADKRDYRVVHATNRDNQRVLVLWRDMDGLDPARERAFLEPRIQAAGPCDVVWINGDSATPGTQSLDAEFARLMEGEAEA